MSGPLFGIETEYAISGIGSRSMVRREDLVARLVHASHQLVHLPDLSTTSGVFLENGARFYIDCGLHPEMTTPECATPWEAARYIQAGERIVTDLVQQVQSGYGGGTEIMCFRCNVDYSGSGST